MPASLLPLERAPAPARGRLLRQPVDTRKSIWQAAVLKYEMEVGASLVSLDVPCLHSSAAIFDYLTRCEDSFKSFRGDGLQRLRDRLCPIAGVVEMLCGALGEGFALAFSPGKAIFSAVGVLIKASLKVREEFDAVGAAFETIRNHLRILQPITRDSIDGTLFEASVELLAQILIVLGVITKLQRQGRMNAWIRQLCQTKEVSSALNDLGRLATGHHAAVSAVTLATSQRSLGLLVDTVAWMAQERDIGRAYLTCIAKLAQNVYGTAKGSRSILESIQKTLLHHISVNQDDKGLRDFDKLCVWLHYPDSSLRMDKLLRDRADSTGSWFLDGPIYSAFKTGKEPTVCALGKAGCGKSTLIAAAVRDLQAWCAISHAPSFTISHFFDLTNPAQPRDLRALLSALLCQITRNWPDAVPILLKLHAESMMGHSQPSLDALRRCTGTVIRSISTRVFVVIDALDEVQDAAEILSFLAELRAHDNVSLLVSSREIPYRDELATLCDSRITMEEDVVTSDIDIVLDRLLCKGGALSEVTDVELVREGLRTGSDGNFRWTVIQANELARVASIPAKVRKRLRTLPKSLGELYARCLDTVPPDDRADVHRILIWLVFACSPLSADDVAQLLSFDYTEPTPVFDTSLQPSSTTAVLSLIGSTFITVQDGEVRLAHASVKDFLLSIPSTSQFHVDINLAHSLMVRTCLAYIYSGATVLAQGGPYLHHMTWSWVVYISRVDQEQYRTLEGYVLDAFSRKDTQESHGDVLKASLHTAAGIDHVPLMQLLIKYLRADVNCFAMLSHDERRPALQRMALCPGIDISSLLKCSGPGESDTIGGKRPIHGSMPLHRAASRGHEHIARVLLDANAYPHIPVDGGWTPLHIAARNGHSAIVHLLLSRGVAPDTCEMGMTPLALAAYHDHEAVVELLLDAGANPNSPTEGGFWSPLHTASSLGHVAVVQLLVARGANVSITLDDGRTPLHLAAECGHSTIARLLLGGGADVGAHTQWCWTPLHYAARDNQLDVARLLLKRGAAVNAYTIGKVGGSGPLQLAAYNEHADMVCLLLGAGADPNAHTNDGHAPLDFVGIRPGVVRDLAVRDRVRHAILQAGGVKTESRVEKPPA